MTRPGSPLAGSVKLADPPTGTLEAGPIAVPDGVGAVVAGEEPPGAAVVGVVGVVGVVEPVPAPVRVGAPPAEAAVPPTSRPRSAAIPALTATTPAAMPATAPRESTARRDISPSRGGPTGCRSASQVSRAGAPAEPPRANGVQAKKKTMSDPVKYGEAWKLTVKKSPNERAMPATAATRVHRPTRTPSPMATSPREMSTPTVEAMGTRWLTSPWMGLEWEAPTSWAWIEDGLELLRKSGLANFWIPAKRKVTPRNTRSGISSHPVATVPSGRFSDHMESVAGPSTWGWDRALAERTRLDAFEVTARVPLPGTIQVARLGAASVVLSPAIVRSRRHWVCPSTGTGAVGGWWEGGQSAYPGAVDQLAVAPNGPTTSAPRSRADGTMRRLLRVPDDRAPIDESETHRIFSASIFLSALRCLLSYIVLPVVLPAIGVARGVGPAIGIPVGMLALTFDYLGIRRFWLADHRQRWAFTALYAVVGTMVAALVIVDIVDALH